MFSFILFHGILHILIHWMKEILAGYAGDSLLKQDNFAV